MLDIPPPVSAELPVKAQSVSTGVDRLLSNPPPQRAELPAKLTLVSSGEDSLLRIPPPQLPAELPTKLA